MKHGSDEAVNGFSFENPKSAGSGFPEWLFHIASDPKHHRHHHHRPHRHLCVCIGNLGKTGRCLQNVRDDVLEAVPSAGFGAYYQNNKICVD